MDTQGHVSLGDFNAAMWVKSGDDEKLHGITGTTSYMAPELLLRQGYSFSVDWWSLGVVMFECIYGRRPFRKQDHGGSKEKLRMAILKENITMPDDRSVSVDCIAVIRGLLCSDPAKRLGCGNDGYERLRRHAFFAGVDWRLAEKCALSPEFVPGCHVDLLGPTLAVDGLQENVSVDNNSAEINPSGSVANVADCAAQLRALERGFTGYSFDEFARYREYLKRHGKIAASDRLDVYLAHIHLDGRPLATMDGDGTAVNENPDEAESGKRKAHFYASVAAGAVGLAHRARGLGAAHPDSDDLAARVKRRTTTSDTATKSGNHRERRSWRLRPRRQPLDTDSQGVSDADHGGLSDGCGLFSDADVYSQKDSMPPSNVPIDLIMWAQMHAGQRRLAHRFSAKIDIDAAYSARVQNMVGNPFADRQKAEGSVAQVSGSMRARGTRGMRALTGNLPATHTLSSPSSSPSLYMQKQQQQQITAHLQQQQPQRRVRQRPSFLHSVRHQPSTATLTDCGMPGSGCSSPTTLQTMCPLSPGTPVPRLQPIASGWTKQPAAAAAAAAKGRKDPQPGVVDARDMPVHQRLENQLVL
ncbi:hypothetical protein IWW45_003330 [Coemansia sp. RSA 485]|nr:hypothetical protein IWW45_003330 [Coemansia sp. RSA 485]